MPTRTRPWILSLCLLAGACHETEGPAGDEPPEAVEPETEEPSEPTPDDEPPTDEPARGAPSRRTVYVPAYSHLGSERGRPILFAITLSVRNVDPTATITLTHVDYFDTSGHRVRRYLRAPRRLRPLETAEFSVETFDEVGGSGANFLVYWEGPSDAHPLLTETVMIGHVGTSHVTFTSRGVELKRPPRLPSSGEDPPPPAQPTE